jgi:hypothetical protein
MDRKKPCGLCGGFHDPAHPCVCPTCGGSGTVGDSDGAVPATGDPPGLISYNYADRSEMCPMCRGTGRL